jgi:predicted ATPase
MSDGTLRLLAHLAAIYSPTPPPLMAFEEPENNIHPHLHELLADVLRGASKRSQILVATHSPHFLDYRRFDLDDLVIVEKIEGKTHCKKLSKKDRRM